MSGKYEHLITDNMYDMVANMNVLFGNTPVDVNDGNNWVPRFKSQVSNVVDEIEELEGAIRDEDGKEILDAIGDILTFLLGGGYLLNDLPKLSDVPQGEVSELTREEILSELYAINTTMMDAVAQALTSDDTQREIELIVHDMRELYRLVTKNTLLPPSVDLTEVMKEITRSNHTKICETIEHRDKTLEHYRNLGIDVYSRQIDMDDDHHWVVYSSSDQLDNNGKQYRKDKFLKCVVTFREPDLISFLNH